MKNPTLALKANARKRLAVLSMLIIVCSPCSGVTEELAIEQPVDEDLQHWLSLYQEISANEEEIECLARNIYFEARSESELGQRAVGHVVMNRVVHKGYPNSICAVVKQGGEKRRHRCQFSWWCDGRSDQPMNRKAWMKSLTLAKAIYQGISKDPTDGALWYHAEYVKPVWSSALVFAKKIGQHLFYSSKSQPVYAMNSASTL